MFPSETRLISRYILAIVALAFAPLCGVAEEPDAVKRLPVESSNLAGIGYDARQKILEVEFHSGSIYRYMDVPEEVFAGIMAADSKGRYFTARIRNQYRFERVKTIKTPSKKP